MKKILLLLALLPLMASAQTLIDGIYYYYDTDSKLAAVTSGDIKYTGSVTIPETVVINGVPCSVIMMIDNAFKDCTALTSITIPNSVTEIEKNTFYGCSGLTSVSIPNSVTSIGNYAFYGCSSLTSIEIPNSVTWIGENAFDGTAWYDNQPDGMIYAGMVVYKYKGTMPENTSIILKEGIKSIGYKAFSKCSGLISITIPNSVITIGDVAFEYCSGLTSIEIPNSVTSIGSNAFYGCTGLTSAKIGNSVTAIKNWTFYNCSSLTSIEIPNSVKGIGQEAFRNCSGLTSVSIGNSVTSIGRYAFYGCSKVTSLIIPNSVTTIGEYAFSGCSALQTVTIGNSVTSIEKFAFDLCKGLTSVTIGSSVTSIGDRAFQICLSLKDVCCYAEEVPNTTGVAFDTSPIGSATLHVPAASLEAYKATTPWSYFGTIVALDGSEPTPAGIAIDETNFSDEAFRNWVLSQEYGQDGVLTEEEIASVTKIDVSMKSIKSLKGIEYFTALTTLECYNNLLTSLEVSACTALTYLRCSGNKLTSLDVSKNTVLKTLLCGENQLTALDVSNNTVLTRLDCNNPNLKTLNVSGCKALYELNISGTKLTSLDLSGKTNLKMLNCTGNQLKSLNVSGCTSLRDLSCYNNQLTTLNVSGCSGLKELYCSNNQLTSIDATGCVILRELQCHSNKIQGKAMDDFIASLPTTSGRIMYVINNVNEGNVMTTTQADAAKAKGWTPYYYENGWQEYAGSEPEPEGISIDETNFPDANFRNWLLAQDYGADGVLTETEIAGITSLKVSGKNTKSLQGIEYFTALKELDCYKSQLEALDLSHNTALTSLRCYANKLTSLDLLKNTALEELHCYNNQLTSLDVSGCAVLKKLYCYNNQLTSLDLSKNTALVNLNCLGNKLTFIDVSGCVSLQTLHCYKNQLNGEDMDAFVASLPTVVNKPLYVIYSTNEGNVMTTTQVAAAKAKGWIPYYYDGSSMQEYAGSEPEVMKCATPFVAFYGGKLVFMCETEDVEYKYQIATPLMSESDGTNVSLPTKIQLIIYATKDGYEPSDTVTKEIDLKALIGQLGDVNGDGEIGMADIMYMVQYLLNGKFPNE